MLNRVVKIIYVHHLEQEVLSKHVVSLCLDSLLQCKQRLRELRLMILEAQSK